MTEANVSSYQLSLHSKIKINTQHRMFRMTPSAGMIAAQMLRRNAGLMPICCWLPNHAM
jgi:hypothetical protein